MAQNNFQIFKQPDTFLIEAIKKIVKEIEAPHNTIIRFSLGKDYPQAIQVHLSEIDINPNLQKILKLDSALFYSVDITFPNFQNSSIKIERQEASDNAQVNFSNQLPPDSAALLLSAAHTYLLPYVRTENTDKLLGDELAEFYRRREAGLLRLEGLSQKLIEDNNDYRLRLDKEHLTLKENLEKNFGEFRNSLEKVYQVKEEKLKEREESLQHRTKELDDHNSKHARRQLRKELKDALATRSKEFTLTKKTNEKRVIVHLLFILLLAVFSITLGYLVYKEDTSWYAIIRLGWSTVAFAATVIFYIRWNDQWFRQHADEEFRLKQLELDIDRASWVVEMALEWKDEKGTEIPEELIGRLTQSLFVDRDKTETPKHPSEDLASALLSASTGLTIKIPGVGEAILDRKGMQKFKKAASETRETE